MRLWCPPYCRGAKVDHSVSDWATITTHQGDVNSKHCEIFTVE